MTTDIFVLSAVRTAIGTFGGALRNVAPSRLAATVIREALVRCHVEPTKVEHVVMGNVIPTEPRDAYLSRAAAIEAGIPLECPAFNVNRLCGSGLQAVVSASQGLMLGDSEIAVAGGAESMSRAPYLAQTARWGARMGDAQLLDYMAGVLHDPFQNIHMGMTAENVAEREGVSREQQDDLALESQRRAFRAISEGRFSSQIVSIELPSKKGTTQFDRDEHVRADVTREQLAAMRPAFKTGGTVTAGNASGVNDGAAALVLATGAAVKRYGLEPMARLVGYAHAGLDPAYMGLGPIPATRALLSRTGLRVSDFDVIESNEAFAAQAYAVCRTLKFDPAKVNPNGSGIALGHPIGATGAINSVKAVHELQRTGGRYALVTMCIGGGQGIAAAFERV